MAEVDQPQGRGRLQDFDYRRYGPLLGISDSGEVGATIVDAGISSARFRAGDLSATGVILDLERMGSSGETPVGPPEYELCRQLGPASSFLSTNVGVRTNARIYQPFPEIALTGLADPAEIAKQVLAEFAPYQTPQGGGAPRPLQVRLRLEGEVPDALLADLTARIEAARGAGLSTPDLHVLGLVKVFDHPLGEGDGPALRALIAACARAGIAELAVDAAWRAEAKLRNGVQGLLNILPAAMVNPLLDEAAAAGVRLVYRFANDVECMTRTIWQGLASARGQGMNAAKYGLTPLTFEEQTKVVTAIQSWFADWTAVPAFYCDTPLVTADHVYFSDELEAAAELWLDMVAGAGARLVLFDCPDRYVPRIDVNATSTARRIVRVGEDERGALTLDQIRRLRNFAEERDIGILWSGGIQHGQAFALGAMGAAGIFTTGSTAVPAPVGPVLAPDPRMPYQPEPTRLGVRRVHALLTAGFIAYKSPAGVNLPQLEVLRTAVETATGNSPELSDALDAIDDFMTDVLRSMWR